MIKCSLVIDDEWHPFWIASLHDPDLHRIVIDLFIEKEGEDIETEAFDPTAPWRTILVTVVVMGDQPQAWFQFSGTHHQVMGQMQQYSEQWNILQ